MKTLHGLPAILTRRAWHAGMLAAALLVALAPSASAQQGAGLRAGISANPDQFFIGGHYVTGPIAGQLRFQPNVEAGFGDDTTLVALNAEFGYWMRINKDWQAYFGGGPAMNIISRDNHDGSDVEPGLNILAGLRWHSGLFFEMKVGAIDSPDFKFGIGYTFK